MNINVDGIYYYVDVIGDGFPIILLHGFTGDSTTWKNFYDQWGQNRKLLAIDIIGHGKSDSPKDVMRYDMLSVTHDLKKMLEFLEIEKADFLGYSMGGRLALSFAVQYPSFFAAGNEKYIGERFFWKDPSDENYMIGLGISKQIESDQAADRFFHVETEWKRLIDQTIIFDDYRMQGTGPTAFGGFSFDPLKESTILWSKFPASLFHIPKFMLSLINGQAYLTTNVVCTHHDDLSLYTKTEQERRKLLIEAKRGIEFDVFKLIKKEEIKPEEWMGTVTQVVKDLKKGLQKKVVLARELRLHFDTRIQVEKVLNRLLIEQSDSYVFAFESNGDCFIGASPERLVKKQGNRVYSTCLAGSIARGKDELEDEQLGETLLTDDKNLSEHQYVVDMIKEAIEDTCFEVVIPEYPRLLKLRHIQHLYTPVNGKVDQDTSMLLIAKRLHPTPALGGLPKRTAVMKIREVETLDRGLYGGPLGWFDHKGNGEFAVAIRSGLIQGNEASIFAGCGVVEDSIAEMEYQETNIKFKPMLSALGGLNS